MRELIAASVHLVKSKSITEFNSQWKGDSHDGEEYAVYCQFGSHSKSKPDGQKVGGSGGRVMPGTIKVIFMI